MPSNIKVSSTDLDDLFEARTTAKIADVGYKVAGVDISNRYEKLASGSATTTTNYKTAGADLNTLFAGLGTVGGGLAASLSTASATGSCTVLPCTATSNSVTCNASGGTPPYSYAWEQVSGDASISITSPSSDSTTFSASSETTETTKEGVFRCKVTDSASAVVYSNNVNVTLTFGAPP